jgi:SAM-dependent methyltransferase
MRGLPMELLRGVSDWVDLQHSLLVELLSRVAPQARGRLLDVGCGQRPFEHLFAPYVSEYIGIEHEATFGKTNASTSARKPDLYYDGERLPFDAAAFDTVLSVQVLEHTPEPGLLVKEMGRVLKPGGLLVLSAPFQFRLHEQPHDYFRYSPHGLRTLCEAAGLEIFETLHQGSMWSVIVQKLNAYLAFRVARVSGMAQAMGKLSHEAPASERARYWTLPFVAPAMVGLAGGARALDWWLPDAEESLGFLILARKRPA